MQRMKPLFGIAALLIALAASVHAQTVAFNGIGSSALFLELGQAAGTASTASTTTTTTPVGLGATCVWSSNANLISALDPTTNQTETGNVWIAWTTGTGSRVSCSAPGTDATIYSYLQTDSTVGDRCFFNACTLEATPGTSGPSGASSSNLLGLTEVSTLPAAIWTALNGKTVNAAGTDIRPEDAAFATLRATTPCTSVVSGSQYYGLGYTSGGTPISSEYSSSSFHVTAFTLPSSFAVTSVGAVPIVVFVNPTNTSGFGSSTFTNISRTDLAHFLDGTYGNTSHVVSGSNAATTVLIREPLSGTYNTMEYAVPNTTTNSQNTGLNLHTSQDVSLTQQTGQSNCASDGTPLKNPLNMQSYDNTSAYRNRVIGTGQMISVTLAAGTTKPTEPLNTLTPQTQDTLGYAFWSAANFKNATSTNAKYLKVDGYDPLVDSYSTTSGQLPTSGNGYLSNVTFNNLKNGNYPIWSMLRLVSASPAPAAVTSLATAAQNFVSTTTQPDFVPASSLNVLHSHFTPPGITVTPANGASGCTPEAGGDVGGSIISAASCVTGLRM